MMNDMFAENPITFADEISEIEFDLSNRATNILMDIPDIMNRLKGRAVPMSLMQFLNDAANLATTVQKLEDARDK